MTGAWLLATIATIAGLLAFVVADQPVSRRRLAKFAHRHRMTMTGTNAPHVVRYLALTRRWRVAGLFVGLTAYLVDGLRHQRIGISILFGLAGWFAGAVAAEVRGAGPVTAQRVASLQRRSRTRYVTVAARVGLVAATVLCLLVVVVGAATGLTASDWVVALVAGAGLMPVVLLVSRHVVVRSQPVDAGDLLAADEAIRAESLQVVHAAALTLMLYAAAGPLLVAVADRAVELAIVLNLVAAVGIPLVGWRLGRGRRPGPSLVPNATA